MQATHVIPITNADIVSASKKPRSCCVDGSKASLVGSMADLECRDHGLGKYKAEEAVVCTLQTV